MDHAGAPEATPARGRLLKALGFRGELSIDGRTRSAMRTGGVSAAAQVGAISVAVGAVIVIQDAVIASYFGAGAAADAYQLAMSFPVAALNVFAGGTLLAVLVPRLIQLEISGDFAAAASLVRQARRGIGWLLAAVSVVWLAGYPFIIQSVAADLPVSTHRLSSQLLWLALPALIFTGLSSVEASVLNSRQRFGLLSALPAFMPAGVAVSVLLLAPRIGIVAAPLGYLAGSTLQLLVARRSTSGLLPGDEAAFGPAPALGPLMRDYGAAAGSAACLGGIYLTDTFMASTFSPGSTATFGYATRPIILLLAFVTAVIGNTTLPMFSKLAARSDLRTLELRFAAVSGALASASLPLVLIIGLLAPRLVGLLYERGTFSPADTANVAAVLRVYVLHVPCFLVAIIGWRVMNSLQQHAALLVITSTVFVTNLAADFSLRSSSGLSGIAWGTNAAFTLWAILIVAHLHRMRRR
jgi:putative peptidoglycan lipid II flippase